MDCRVVYPILEEVFAEEPELLEWLILKSAPQHLEDLESDIAENPFRGLELPGQVRLMREAAEARVKQGRMQNK